MSHFRRARFAVTLLLVVSALFVAVESNFVNVNVYGAGSLTLNPSSGPTGSDVGVSGALPIATNTCSISSPTSGLVINPSCAITGGIPGTTFNGSFTVGNVRPGQYVIQVTGGTGSNNFVQATFTVNDVAKIQLSTGPPGGFYSVGQVANGPVGTHVTVEGTNFMSTDTTCSIGVGSGSSSSFIASGSAACAVFTVRNSTGGYLSMNVTGSFVVGSVPPGQYVVQVSGNRGDFAQAVFNVTSGPFIQLFPSKGPTGTSVNIEGTNFLSTDTTCSISSPTTSSVITGAACSVFTASSGPFLGFRNVTGSFIVGNVPAGQYVIRVSGNKGDFAEAVFNVTGGPTITLSPGSGRIGIHVVVNGTGFLLTDTTCTLSSPTTSSVLVGPACSLTLGTGRAGASFIVGNVAPGQYVIRITGSPRGDFAEAIFNVTLGPSITLNPGSGRIGGHVLVNGTGFLPGDTSCSITSPTTSSFITFAACAINAGTGTPSGSFTVGNVAPGQYVVRITGSPGSDFGSAVFNVTIGPTLTLNPGSGRIGVHVLVNGTGFLPLDSTCSISSPSTPGAVQSGTAACSIVYGSGAPQGSFTIGNILPGQYRIRVSGNQGDFAEAVFNVTVGPTISLSPATGRPGTHVNVNGTGFLPTDGTCTISSPGSSAVTGGSQACAIQLGTGVTSGSFIIGNVLPGQYLIQVSGNQGDFAQTVLNVTSGPSVTLSPATGSIGSSINVNGTGFLPTDISCTIVSGSSNVNNPIAPSSAGCVITVGTGIVRGSFVIGFVPPGQYVIQVNGNGGDSAQAILNVLPQATTLTLYPTNATNGATVTFRATGLSTSDTGCVVLSGTYNLGVFTPNTIVLTSPTCTVPSPTIATGSFVVGPYATQDKNWTIRVRGTPANDIASAVFNVTASITVTPSSGTINTVFTFTGSGFESTATTCTATIVPPFPASTPACYISPGIGQVSGSVIVPTTAVPGTYGIYVLDNTGSAATGFFTVGTPSAIVVLDPASAGQGQQVGVAGTGFNPSDTYCTITAGTGSSLPWVGPDGIAPTCAISGGFVSGSFRVSDTATGGYYLITVTGYTGAGNTTRADFAMNFLAVTLDTTITTFSSTTTTTTSSTTLSTTSTSVATSLSISSTTFSTTGNSYTTFFQTTITTVSGLTTSTLTATISTSQTQTTIQATTLSLYTTVSCGPLPCGFAIGSQNINVGVDNIGLLALLLILPMLLRRLFS